MELFQFVLLSSAVGFSLGFVLSLLFIKTLEFSLRAGLRIANRFPNKRNLVYLGISSTMLLLLIPEAAIVFFIIREILKESMKIEKDLYIFVSFMFFISLGYSLGYRFIFCRAYKRESIQSVLKELKKKGIDFYVNLC
ncbi:hypothetical protein [Aquifex sp.]